MNQISRTFQYISQGNCPNEHIHNCLSFLKAGGKWVQLRLKGYTMETIHHTLSELIYQSKSFTYQLILNDYVEVAASFEHVGCHVGKEDMPLSKARAILGPRRILGATANTHEDIRRIAQYKVDYIGLGPFAFTETKKKLSPILGLTGYTTIIHAMNEEEIQLPIIAIGGIQQKDIASILDTGVFSIAASSLWTAPVDIIKKRIAHF